MDQLPLPPHGTTEHTWEVLGAPDATARPYLAALPPALAPLRLNRPQSMGAACATTALELAVLARSAQPARPAQSPHPPQPPTPTHAGISAVLIQAEALASSLVDGDIADSAALARAEAGQPSTAAARRITAAAGALAAHLELSRRAITLGSIAAAHTRPRRLASGRTTVRPYRAAQTWVGGSDLWPEGASYVPPHPSRIPELMEDLVAFCARDDVDPIVQAAMAHAQVLAVQPFDGGHTRVAGAVVNSVLARRGLLAGGALPVSAALIRHRRDHAKAMEAYRAGDAAPIVSLMAAALLDVAAAVGRASAAWALLPDAWDAAVGARRGSAAKAMTGLLLAHPVVDADTVRRLTGASQASAYEAVARLADAGVLTRISPGRRDTAWAALQVFQSPKDLVDDLIGGSARQGRPPARRRSSRSAAA